MLEAKRYKRTKYNYTVLAVRVTKQNMKDVALWCGGDVKRTQTPGTGRLYISVRVNAQTQARQKTFVGDWIVKGDHGSPKSYNNDAFHKSFDSVDPLEVRS